MKKYNYEDERTKCLKNIRDAFDHLLTVTSTDACYLLYLTQYRCSLEVFYALCNEQGVDPRSDNEFKAIMMEIKLRRW